MKMDVLDRKNKLEIILPQQDYHLDFNIEEIERGILHAME